MNETPKEVFENAEAVLREGKCRCGRDYIAVKIKSDDTPRVMHKNPPCEAFTKLSGVAYLAWLDSPEGPVIRTDPSKPVNRRQRRAEARKDRRRRKESR